MVIKLLLLLLCLEFISATYNCNLKFKYQKVCRYYKYDERCFTGQTEFCQVLVTKRDELKCPYFVCTPFNDTIVDISNFLGKSNSSLATLDLEHKQIVANNIVNLNKSEIIKTSSVDSKSSDNNKTNLLQLHTNDSSVIVEKQKLPVHFHNITNNSKISQNKQQGLKKPNHKGNKNVSLSSTNSNTNLSKKSKNYFQNRKFSNENLSNPKRSDSN